ncbi:2,4-dinitroanisole O-demethylase subunit alpha [BD1-7 clade bacterium]|uniref:2,4-dinitroanisole O-demethylase subunit alpha n=1 Tax=BD1-7 clade bacterium TaxID=2029982 RepID=A0A5S9Q5S4_9GAMM|nr:2,4-dinitroanisole O-demethylase subunit alpha [BD1-7 clade bacterium]
MSYFVNVPAAFGRLAIACTLFALTSIQAVADDYRIEKVKDNVYRFVDDRHRNVFMVTEDAIIATDPINTRAATWLKAEIKKRFNKPIKFVVYSHNHTDHVYGGEVFKSPDTRFVAQELARQDLAITHANTVIPDITFKDAMHLYSGTNSVELKYWGDNDGRGSISMLFKPAKVMYVVDWIVLGRMPWQKLWSYDIQGMINSTEGVLKEDFDIFVGGHGEVGTKKDVQESLDYLKDLYAAVIQGVLKGESLDYMKTHIKLPKYKHLAHYEEWLPLNIEGVYNNLMEKSGQGWRPDLP